MGSKAQRKALREKRRQISKYRSRRLSNSPSFSEYMMSELEKENLGAVDMARKLTRSQRTILGT